MDVAAYEYSGDGIRIAKIVDGVRYEYTLDGTQVQAIAYELEETAGGVTYPVYYLLQFTYDELGAPVSMRYIERKGTLAYRVDQTYYYVKNMQGDVVALTNAAGSVVATYTYDAWGNQTVSWSTGQQWVAEMNPFRYRGYFYDTETGFYYLTSRYYDPEVGRFISADSPNYLGATGTLLSDNLFAYCENNPVRLVDGNGTAPLKVARLLLTRWFLGKGKDLVLNKKSIVSKKLKKSNTMQEKIDEEIEKFENGEEYGSGTVVFDANETDLWLGIRQATYEVSIVKETKTTGFWIFKMTKTRYVVDVKVSDTYNFNTGDEAGDGLGSLLNNFGFWLQEQNLGAEYKWEANYVYKTKWK